MLPYLFVLITPLSLILSFFVGGWGSLIPLGVLFVWLPITDHLIGWNRENPAEVSPNRQRIFQALPVLYAVVHLGVLGWALHQWVVGPWSLWERLGLGLGMGFTGGVAIAIAHELMHRQSFIERRAAELMMASTCYTHFCIEHVFGHHRNVGTPTDPATSRLGESLYAFFPRTIWGGLRSAWQIEAQRLTVAQKPVFSHHNRMFRYAAAQVVLLAAITASLGGLGLLGFLFQSVIAVLLLELINYIEHYGLSRDQEATGRFERVRPEHSWNASHRLSNWMIFNLARHSDHHAFAGRHYQDLRHYEDVPQLPTGYTGMMLLALVPSLWFRVMDPRVAAWKASKRAA